MTINLKDFNFSFFLSGRTKVNSLEEGAILFGGATKFTDGIYSNISNNDIVEINNTNNTLSVYVPSTNNINQQYDNREIVLEVMDRIERQYDNDIILYDTNGSWFSEELQQVVIEEITMVEITLNTITESDILYFVEIADYVKSAMNQEGVSIQINSALAIV